MPRRDRLEDFGRILVLSEQLLKHEIFQNDAVWGFPKYSCDKFEALSEEQKETVIQETSYSLQDIHEKIMDISLIASARDDLNLEEEQPVDGY